MIKHNNKNRLLKNEFWKPLHCFPPTHAWGILEGALDHTKLPLPEIVVRSPPGEMEETLENSPTFF